MSSSIIRYSEHEKDQFKTEFAKRKKRQWLVTLGILPLIVLLVVIQTSKKNGNPLPYDSILLGVAIGGVVLALAFSFYNWRCPACQTYFGKIRNPIHCPNCGIELI